MGNMKIKIATVQVHTKMILLSGVTPCGLYVKVKFEESSDDNDSLYKMNDASDV